MNEPMRVLQVMPFFSERYGGCVTQARTKAAGLAARGHRVRVLTSDLGIADEVPRNEWVAHDGYEVYHARTTAPWHRIPPYVPPRIRDILDAEIHDASVVCANVGLTLWNRLVRRTAQRHRKAYVYNAEGALCPRRLRIKRWSKRVFVPTVERDVLRDAAAIQAVTRKEARDAEVLGASTSRVHVIPNGVPIPPQTDPDARRQGRSRLDLPEDAKVVLFLGRLHAIKGIDILVDAFADAAPEHPDIVLALAGPDDGERRAIEARAAQRGVGEQVRFLGMLDGDARRDALAASDLFALTSRTEGLPLAALEAAAAGLPLLVSNDCNIPEVETEGAGSVTAPEREPVSVALRSLLSSDALRERCGQNARAMAERRFAADSVVDRIETMLRSVARG